MRERVGAQGWLREGGEGGRGRQGMWGEPWRILVAKLEEIIFLTGGISYQISFQPILDKGEAILMVTGSFNVVRFREDFFRHTGQLGCCLSLFSLLH